MSHCNGVHNKIHKVHRVNEDHEVLVYIGSSLNSPHYPDWIIEFSQLKTKTIYQEKTTWWCNLWHQTEGLGYISEKRLCFFAQPPWLSHINICIKICYGNLLSPHITWIERKKLWIILIFTSVEIGWTNAIPFTGFWEAIWIVIVIISWSNVNRFSIMT